MTDSAFPSYFQGVVWATLTSDPHAGVSIVTREGRTLWLNDQAARLFYGDQARASDYIGLVWREHHDPAWIEERVALLRQIEADGRPRLLRTIWLGWQLLSWIHPIEPASDDAAPEPRFLVISRRAPVDVSQRGLTDGDYALVDSAVADLGPLAVLTSRELEVLALLGQGLSSKEIGRVLHRSPKTVENHRNAIGQKLGVSDRLALAEMARRAGLRRDDVRRRRVRSRSA